MMEMLAIKGLWFLMVLLPFQPDMPAHAAQAFGHYESEMECRMNIAKVANLKIVRTKQTPRELPGTTQLGCRFMVDQPSV